MNFDLSEEELIPFSKACKEFPGGGVCLQTLHRWRLRGIRGVKLETIMIGGRRYTSRAAIGRFVAAQNKGQDPPPLSVSQRAKRSAAARLELEKMGI
ncbi:MAG: hypothetical protein JWN70_6157 [Planctomycetaceae bacterium]|nr:hypothetical protein [Planctomycetaceae bacterium]